MADTQSNSGASKGRGLASASEETRKKVAKMGGEAYHQKRGRSGSDSRTSDA